MKQHFVPRTKGDHSITILDSPKHMIPKHQNTLINPHPWQRNIADIYKREKKAFLGELLNTFEIYENAPVFVLDDRNVDGK